MYTSTLIQKLKINFAIKLGFPMDDTWEIDNLSLSEIENRLFNGAVTKYQIEIDLLTRIVPSADKELNDNLKFLTELETVVDTEKMRIVVDNIKNDILNSPDANDIKRLSRLKELLDIEKKEVEHRTAEYKRFVALLEKIQYEQRL